MIGQRFGRLTVVARSTGRRNHWLCKCDCGNDRTVYAGSLRLGYTRSCGCLRREASARRVRARVRRHINVGDRFGRLTALYQTEERLWLCRCTCGARKEIDTYCLLRGETRSCGCFQREARIKHGMTYTNEHRIWRGMVARCTQPSSPQFKYYGGRGIAVAEEWRRDFPRFLADVGPRPSPSQSLDRIDNSRGYEPGNVRWATHAEQSRNTRRNRWMEFRGERLTITDLAAKYGINHGTFRKRLKNGWTLEEALTVTP